MILCVLLCVCVYYRVFLCIVVCFCILLCIFVYCCVFVSVAGNRKWFPSSGPEPTVDSWTLVQVLVLVGSVGYLLPDRRFLSRALGYGLVVMETNHHGKSNQTCPRPGPARPSHRSAVRSELSRHAIVVCGSGPVEPVT